MSATPPKPFHLSGREALWVGLAAAAWVSLACLTPPSFLESQDVLKLHLPNKVFAADAVRSGSLPLWNPHVGLGRPFLADIETALFYPPNLLHIVLPPAVAFALLCALHLALAVVAMRWLGVFLGMSPVAAWLAGASFAGCGALYATLQTGQLPFSQATAYLPLVVLLGALWQDVRSLRVLAAFALVLALQLLCGHPQAAWVSWLGVAAFLAGRSVTGDGGRSVRRLATGLLGLAAALGWAFAIAAVQLMPFFELRGEGNRSLPSLAFSAIGPMTGVQWLTLLVPAFPVAPLAVGWSLQIGALIVLAGLGGAHLVRRPDVRGLWLVAIVAIVVAAGLQTPIFGWLYRLLPGLSAFRFPSRAALLVILAVCAWAGLFLSEEQRPTPQVKVVLWLGAGVVLLAVGWWYGWFVPAGQSRLVPWAVHSAVALAAVFVLVSRDRFETTGARRRWWALAIAALAVELVVSTAQIKPFYVPSGPFPTEAVVARTLRDAGLARPGAPPPRISVPYPLVRDNAGMVNGWSTFSGYGALSLDRVWTVLHSSFGISAEPETYPSPEIFQHGPFPYRSMSLVLGFDPASGRLVLQRNPDPRAMLVHTTRRVTRWREAARLISAGHDGARMALVEQPVELDEGEPGRAELDRAEIVRFASQEVAVRTASDRRTLLVLKEAWYPGWRVRVDGGAETACLPVNAWMRGTVVPKGAHEVVFRFHSRFLGWGAALSALALGLCAAALAMPGFARSRSR